MLTSHAAPHRVTVASDRDLHYEREELTGEWVLCVECDGSPIPEARWRAWQWINLTTLADQARGKRKYLAFAPAT